MDMLSRKQKAQLILGTLGFFFGVFLARILKGPTISPLDIVLVVLGIATILLHYLPDKEVSE